MSDDPLARLAGQLADGVEVDWEQAEAEAAQRGELDDVRGLRALATLALALGSEHAPVRHSAPPRAWGPLRLRERIGAGSFGEVYRAFDPQLRREVALKLLYADAGKAGAPPLSEARRLARVRHPNVIVVHGAEEHDGRSGLWMELVSGRTLAQVVSQDGPLSAAEATHIGLELCRALAAVHAAGLVHGDVKAGNVMRATGGQILLMDFGAAAEHGALGVTPLYASPEVLAGSAPTVAADIYALGVLLFHLVTASYPVEGQALAVLRAAHASGARRRLRDLRPELPTAFVAAVESALAPAQGRFPSAAALEDALAQTRAQPVRGTGRTRWLWFAPLVAVFVFVAFLLRPVAPGLQISTEPRATPAPALAESAPEPSPSVSASEERGPAEGLATPSVLQPALPVASPLSGPEPPKSGASALEPAYTVDPAVAGLDATLALLQPQATRVEQLEAAHTATCAGLYMPLERNAEWMRPAQLKCRAMTQEIADLRRQIRSVLIQAEDDARRARVLPGDVRMLREKYGLGSVRWEFL